MEALTPVGAEVFSYPPPVDIEKVVQGLCANSPTSRSLCLSLRPKSVQVGPIVGGKVGTPTNDQLDEGRGPARRHVFNVKHIVNFCNVYVSSSLDSLTLRSGVLGEERQVTVFAVRASRYPTQRRRGGNTTFFFRLC